MRTSPRAQPRFFALVAVLILVLTACGGDNEGNAALETTSTSLASPTTQATIAANDAVEPVVLRLTFDGISCNYEGPTELTPGPVQLLFLNDSDVLAAVNLVYLDEGYTIQDVIDDMGPQPSAGHAPSWQHELGTWRWVPAGEGRQWDGNLEAKLHAMVCAGGGSGVWFGTGLTIES